MTHHHESLPGLLSDRQIRELSYFPTLEGLMQELRENHNWLLTNLSHVEDDTQRENIIRKAAQHRLDNWRKPMIEPFEPIQVRYEQHNPFGSDDVPVKPIVSYGTSSYGYDVRCAREFKVFTNIHSTIVDPKSFDPNSFVDIEADHCIIPPNSFALARTMEYIRVPDDVLVVCLGKSTYARCGIIVNVTPLEPGWEGHVTLEFSNTTPLPAKIYAGEGVAQFLFFKGSEPCETTYAARSGKYMKQTGVTLPRT